jgi:hypothetical protein
MSNLKYSVEKLKGQSNYESWSIKLQAIFTQEKCFSAIADNNQEIVLLEPGADNLAKSLIILQVEDGPLAQIKGCKTALEMWKTLSNLYCPQGFSAEFLLLKEFFDLELSAFNTMEEYLNRIKYLTDSLKSKNIELPKQVVLAWVLNNLTPSYEGFVTFITQSFRTDSSTIKLESLFANLIDESRRQTGNVTKTLYTSGNRKQGAFHNKSKVQKPRYCSKCQATTHNTSTCWFLNPEKKPAWFKTKHDMLDRNTSPEPPQRLSSSDSIKTAADRALLTLPIRQEDNMEIDHQVYYTSADKTHCQQPEANLILDSGSTQHIICDRNLFLKGSLVNKLTKIGWGNNTIINSVGIGKVCFTDSNNTFVLHNCLFVPTFAVNLLSVRRMVEKGFVFEFSMKKAIIKKNNIALEAQYYNSMYVLNITHKLVTANNAITPSCLYANAPKDYLHYTKADEQMLEKIKLFHNRFGHKNLTTICQLLNTAIPNNFKLDCHACIKAKLTNKNSRDITPKPEQYLDKIVMDICGPITPMSRNHYRYIIFFLDAATRELNFKLLRLKSEAFTAFVEYKAKVETQSNRKIKIIGSDNGTEFVNQRFKELTSNAGIIHQLSSPYTPEQNGLIERVNRTIIETARALLFSSNMPLPYWQEAVQASVYIYNITPHAYLGKSPFERLYNKKPNVHNLKIWGSKALFKDKTVSLTKLESRAKEGILVGYNQYNYYVLDLKSKKVIQTRDVVILEGRFIPPTEESTTSATDTITVELNTEKNASEEQDNSLPEQDPETSITDLSSPVIPRLAREESPDELGYISNNSNKRVLPSSKQPRTAKRFCSASTYDDSEIDELALMSTNIHDEPSTYAEAVGCTNKEHWIQAMKLELDQLSEQNTWELVHPLPNRKPLRGRWVYKIKTDKDNNIIKYKARWVVKGYSQVYGLDYLETFANTTRIEIIRFLLFLAAYLDLEIMQLDFKNAFVHAPIDSDVYVEQPTGFHQDPTKVCKLRKSLYGLKQAPRAWYNYLKNILAKLNFHPIFAEQGIFRNTDTAIFLIVYVDDVLVIGSNQEEIKRLKQDLAKLLELSDLGEASYFLGMEIIRNRPSRELWLKQAKYIQNMLTKYEKNKLNPISTPADPGAKLTKHEGQASKEDITLFQQYIGSLIYLTTHTRPDIAFAVYNCARHMSNPSKQHFTAANRIFKYLNHTPSHGLYFKATQSAPVVLGYTDADWGGDIMTRRSTTGYLFTFNNTPISWASKLQKTTALSSCEAEYMALKEAIKEYLYLISIYRQLGIDSLLNTETKKFYLFSDSQPAIALANNPEHHAKTKHIDIQYHFVREKIQEGFLDLSYIPTKEQLADILTKALNAPTFNTIFSNLKLVA